MRRPEDPSLTPALTPAPTRRELLHLAGGAALAAGLGCRGGDRVSPPAPPAPAAPPLAPAASPAPAAPPDDAALDEVLERLHAEEPRSKQGLSTHAPMVAEALCALGFADRAKAWVDGYAAPVIELPPPSRRIERGRWREALGPVRGAPTAAFARVYLRHGTRAHAIAFVHAITAPCALRRIAPHVAPATARLAFPYAWQTAAAVYATYAGPAPAPPPPAPRLSAGELAGRAVENGADHAIKLVEVLLAEHALRPDPAYLAAAEDAARRL